jgi:hypothetical protein
VHPAIAKAIRSATRGGLLLGVARTPVIAVRAAFVEGVPSARERRSDQLTT